MGVEDLVLDLVDQVGALGEEDDEGAVAAEVFESESSGNSRSELPFFFCFRFLLMREILSRSPRASNIPTQ